MFLVGFVLLFVAFLVMPVFDLTDTYLADENHPRVFV